MHEEIEAAELAVDRRGQIRDLLVARDVARREHGVRERRRQLPHVLLEPRARIRQREPRARGGRRLRDRPGDGALVGDADDEAVCAGEIRHWMANG